MCNKNDLLFECRIAKILKHVMCQSPYGTLFVVKVREQRQKSASSDSHADIYCVAVRWHHRRRENPTAFLYIRV